MPTRTWAWHPAHVGMAADEELGLFFLAHGRVGVADSAHPTARPTLRLVVSLPPCLVVSGA
jgi:hypothetical protein